MCNGSSEGIPLANFLTFLSQNHSVLTEKSTGFLSASSCTTLACDASTGIFGKVVREPRRYCSLFANKNFTLHHVTMMERFCGLRSFPGCLVAILVFYLLEGMLVSFRSPFLGKNEDFSVTEKNTSITTSVPSYNATIDMKSDPNWWEPYVDRIARSFSIRPDKSWCVPRTIPNSTKLGEEEIQSGFYLVKIQKTASSTVAGVSIQIARNVGQQQHQKDTMECVYHAAHGYEFARRRDPFFLWTVLRDPRKRAISDYFFFEVSRKRIPAADARMMQKLNAHKSYQLANVAPRFVNHPRANASEIVDMMLKNVFGKYHFVGLSDRMDETLVALKFILHVDLRDIVVLSSKRNGGLDDGRHENTCFEIQPANVTPRMKTYLEEEFPVNNHDFFLYAVANRSLDLTIDAIGRDKFQHDLELFRTMSRYAEEQCLDKAIFPCVAAGKPPLPEASHSCYFGDIGCGHACVKEVLRNFSVQ
jgi:hypothetical protein